MYSLSGNIVRAGLSFFTGILIAKGLGPESFGVFGFLLASFTVLIQLLDLGSSSAFSTFISKRSRTGSYIAYYCIWLLIQFCILFSFIYVLAPDIVVEKLWQDEERELVVIAFVAVFMQQKGWITVSQIGESQRLTKHVQLISILVALFHFIIISGLLYADSISVKIIFGVVAAEFAVGILVAVFIFPLKYAQESEPFSKILGEYKKFCIPLIPNAWIMILCMFADTWLLQFYGGAVEQAFYAVAMQFSVICLIATRSILSILWKEVAEAFSNGDTAKVRILFSRSTRWLHSFGAFIACFLIPWTSEIIEISLGAEYIAGAVAMALMFLYPIDQARGQVAGTMLLAMEMTKITLFIGIFSNLFGLIVTYFLVASPTETIPGLGLGSTGLALKMVLVQFLTVNISIFLISKVLKMKESISYQFYVIALFLCFGFGSYVAVNFAIGDLFGFIFKFGVSGLLYTILVGFVVYRWHSLFLISNSQKSKIRYLILSKVRRIMR